jgi:AcrR family transcriptional regulator
MAKPRTERSAWIEAGLDALAEAGPDAVRIEVLARDLGVTKGGFYGYFANRQALLDAVLDAWEEESTKAVVEQVTAEQLDPAAASFRAAQLTWEGGRLAGADLAVRNWARRDADVAARLQRVDTFRLDYVRGRMRALCPDPREAEARSLIAYLSAIGLRYAGVSLADLDDVRRDAVALITAEGSLNVPWR